jgi:hypothetical protein
MRTSKTSELIKVGEYYRNYSPPFDASKPVRRLLHYIPDKYLVGLHSITLTNSQSTRMLRRGGVRSQNRKVRFADCRGLYRAGQVVLLIDKIFLDYPTFFLRLPFFRTYLIGEVLYHEVGHHIHRTKKREHRDEEFVADEWRDKLLRSFMSKRYWYFSVIAVPYRLLIRPIVSWFQRRDKAKKSGSNQRTA